LPLAHAGDKKVKRFHFSEIIGRLPYMRATVTEYLEEKMGLKPSNDQNIPGSTWSRMLKNYQKGTEGIRP
jgi:hypothetical protein